MDRVVALYPWMIATVQGVLGPYTRLWQAIQDSMAATITAVKTFPLWKKPQPKV